MHLQDAMPGSIARSATFRDHCGNVQQDGPFAGEAIVIVSAVRADVDSVSMHVIACSGNLEHKVCRFDQLNRMRTLRGMGSPPPKSAWKLVR